MPFEMSEKNCTVPIPGESRQCLMHDSRERLPYVGVLSNSTEPRGNIYVRHRYSIDYVHRPGSRRYFSSIARTRAKHRARTTHLLPRIPLRALFTRRVSESGHHPSARIAAEHSRIAVVKFILILANGARSPSVFTIHFRTDHPEASSCLEGTNDRLANVGPNRDVNRQDDKSGRDVLRRSVRAGMSRVRAGCTEGRTTRKRETKGERERERGRNVSGRAKARHASSPAD